MLSIFTTDTPPLVADDSAVIETEHEWKTAHAAVEQVRPRYERLKILVNQPANQTLADLNADESEQDEAFGLFPDLARRFHELNAAEQRARQARDAAHAQAYAARQQWYTERLRQIEEQLVELVNGPLYDLVREVRALVDDAGGEEIPIRIEPTQFSDVPLRIGTTVQGGLETVIGTLRALVRTNS